MKHAIWIVSMAVTRCTNGAWQEIDGYTLIDESYIVLGIIHQLDRRLELVYWQTPSVILYISYIWTTLYITRDDRSFSTWVPCQFYFRYFRYAVSITIFRVGLWHVVPWPIYFSIWAKIGPHTEKNGTCSFQEMELL